jgi:hypothetical protein
MKGGEVVGRLVELFASYLSLKGNIGPTYFFYLQQMKSWISNEKVW